MEDVKVTDTTGRKRRADEPLERALAPAVRAGANLVDTECARDVALTSRLMLLAPQTWVLIALAEPYGPLALLVMLSTLSFDEVLCVLKPFKDQTKFIIKLVEFLLTRFGTTTLRSLSSEQFHSLALAIVKTSDEPLVFCFEMLADSPIGVQVLRSLSQANELDRELLAFDILPNINYRPDCHFDEYERMYRRVKAVVPLCKREDMKEIMDGGLGDQLTNLIFPYVHREGGVISNVSASDAWFTSTNALTCYVYIAKMFICILQAGVLLKQAAQEHLFTAKDMLCKCGILSSPSTATHEHVDGSAVVTKCTRPLCVDFRACIDKLITLAVLIDTRAAATTQIVTFINN